MRRIVLLVVLAFLTVGKTNAQDEKKLKLYGDFRFRTEFDRSSTKSDGSERADRDRFRYRLRFGFKYALAENLEFGGRIRSGNPNNPQSPHVTLGKGMTSDAFSIDKAYLKISDKKGYWAWAGKNAMPFYEQNELLWDGDVNPEGLAFGGKFKMGDNASLSPVAAYFVLDNQNLLDGTTTTQKFGNFSNMKLFQLKYVNKMGDNKLTVASGLVAAVLHDNDPNTDDFKFNIWATALQYKMNSGLTLGVDYFSNLADIDAFVPASFKDQKTGYDFSIKYGMKKFSAAFTYAAIQKYAVVDMFAQDDWVRWGNSTMTRSSNFKGIELNFKYKFNKKFNSTLRFWNVKGIEKTGTDLETGTRIRLDFNIKF
jgi:hypothetical protein